MAKLKSNKSTDKTVEYDFSKGVRGKYAKKFAEGSNVVLLDPDLAQLYPDAASVNSALRAIAEIALRASSKKRGA